MKKHFFEYYNTLTTEDKKGIFENCLFVFDTNVILNLYRYSAETRDRMLSIMDKYQNRIWMPYQVGWEFFNNRENVINSISNGCDALMKNIKDYQNSLNKILDDNYKRHPYIDKKEIKDLIENGMKPLNDRLTDLKNSDPKYLEHDIVWGKLTSLFENRIGEDYDAETLNEIYMEGEIRYKHSIPPGYADLKDKKDLAPRHLYGDLIVWKQTMDEAKSRGKDIVFVSDDQKDDWYDETKRGESKRPRRELIKEFGLQSGGHRILLYNQDGFLFYIKQYLGDNIDDKVVTEVKEVAEQEANKLEESRRRTEEILKRYGYMGGNIADKAVAIDSSIATLSSIQEALKPMRFPRIVSGSKLIPEGVTTTLDSMKQLSDLCSSSKIQSAIDSLSQIDDSSANQIRKLTETFTPEVIDKTQKWFDSLPKIPWIP